LSAKPACGGPHEAGMIATGTYDAAVRPSLTIIIENGHGCKGAVKIADLHGMEAWLMQKTRLRSKNIPGGCTAWPHRLPEVRMKCLRCAWQAYEEPPNNCRTPIR
jgi:hypothetical protein